MVKSMTGFGHSGFTVGGREFFLEVKSLNHRYLDTKLKMPERFYAVEGLIKDEIKKRFSRGSLRLSLFSEAAAVPEFRLNMDAAKAFLKAAKGLKTSLGVKGEVGLDLLLKQKDIFCAEEDALDPKKQWRTIKRGIDLALKEVEAWRVKEGGTLERDIKKRCRSINAMAGRIEKRLPRVLAAYRRRVKARLEKLAGTEAGESKVLIEAAAFAERTDVTEEMVRLKSHLDAFKGYLCLKEPVGKRLDFLCQEMLREANTIASKASDAVISQTVVEIKNEVEKIREQVQNIE